MVVYIEGEKDTFYFSSTVTTMFGDYTTVCCYVSILRMCLLHHKPQAIYRPSGTVRIPYFVECK